MAISAMLAEISRFLASSDPEVLCISGKWGVGKTFAWNRSLRMAAVADAVALRRYAYVSLFGRNSLDDIRAAIFENTVPVGKKIDAPSVESMGAQLEAGSRRLSQMLKLLPKVKDYVAVGERVLFAGIAKQIICFDDLERAGLSVSSQDVLGIISELREQKKCKVVILLNEEELRDKDKFREHIEKVADSTFIFEPSAEEAAELGVDDRLSFVANLKRQCNDLGIVNIRVIKKAERNAIILERMLGHLDRRVLDHAIHSSTLYTFAKLQPNEAPEMEFIRRFGRFTGLVGDLSDKEKGWKELLVDYGYSTTDEFDLKIMAGVNAGYFDIIALMPAAKAIEDSLSTSDQHGSFQAAWDIYHGSFDDNADEVIERLYDSFKTSVKTITPMNASGTVKLFKDLGRVKEAEELISYYVNTRDEVRDFWNLNDYAFASDVTDPDLRRAFNEKYISMGPPTRDAGEILIRISKQSGWSPEDTAYLASLAADDYYNLFKKLRDSDLRRAVREALRFSTRGPAGSPEERIGALANEALDRIAKESLINSRRVAQRRADV